MCVREASIASSQAVCFGDLVTAEISFHGGSIASSSMVFFNGFDRWLCLFSYLVLFKVHSVSLLLPLSSSIVPSTRNAHDAMKN
ncbi:unnamed protein product [Cochlearia groenlandica]